MPKYFHGNLLILYVLIDLLLIYVAFIVPKETSASSLYPAFMLLLTYNIVGLYLLHLDIVDRNPSLSKTALSFTDGSVANIQSLISLGLMIVNFILIVMYGLQIANSMKTNTIQGGGRRR